MTARARALLVRTVIPASVVAAVASVAGCAQVASPPADDAVLASLDVAWSRQPSDGERLEQLVAACMAEAGYTYVPVLGGTDAPGAPSGAAGSSADDDADDAGGSPEGPDASDGRAGYGITAAPAPPPRAGDPNAGLVAALSPAEQEAYWVALDGAARADDVDWQYDWRGAGCRGRAQNAVYGDPSTMDDDAALEAELAEARLAAASDPRVAELDAAWAACMTASGHPDLATAGDAEASVRAAWDALWTQAWATLPAEPSDEDVAAAEAAAAPAVADLAAVEMTLAEADRACRAEVDYDAGRDAVAAEYRERFYEAHRTELTAWVAPDFPAAQE